MAGYHNYSMSNNAVDAYYSGEKPLSKWTKKDIIDAIENAVKEDELTLGCGLDKLKKVPVKKLKDLCLVRTSWHHTSNYFNKTDFYSIDDERLESLTDEEIDRYIAEGKEDLKVESKPSEERWKCAFLEWSGTRKRPKATEVVEEGVIKGDWFYRKDGTKKKTTATGFRFLEKLS